MRRNAPPSFANHAPPTATGGPAMFICDNVVTSWRHPCDRHVVGKDLKKKPKPTRGIGVMKHTPISIVVACDQPAFLHDITAILKSDSDMTVVASCSDGTAAFQAISLLTPTVAVLDCLVPGLTGLDVLARISADRRATKVVLLTASYRELLAAFARGAKGVLLKEATPSELVDCIRHVAAGGHWLPSDLIDATLERDSRRSASQRTFESLTKREQQIVMTVADGLSNKVVGRRLDLSEGTVKVHLHNIYRKLGVNNRTALTAMAVASREDLQPAVYSVHQPSRQSAENWPIFRRAVA
jgi:two-component system nitrate/nitrite response regulator NarL